MERSAKLTLGVIMVIGSAACVGVVGEDGVDGVGGGDAVGSISSPACVGEVGTSTLRRIDRQQYDNLISDLLGAKFRPSSVLAQDEKEGPFPANKATLMTRGLASQYQYIAEQVGTEVQARAQTLAPCADVKAQGADCAARFIDDFGRRAFRRPLGPEEKQLWLDLFRQTAGDGYEVGIRSVIEGILQSPSFLFRIESPPSGVEGNSGQLYDVDDYAIATRMSFFLWNSGPDDSLLRAAGEGRLKDPAGLAKEIDRMLEDPRHLRAFEAFTAAWAGLGSLDAAASDPAASRGLDAKLPALMKTEAVNFFDSVLAKGDGKLATLFTAPWSVVDPQLAKDVYGATAAPDADGKTWFDPGQRSGILTNAGFLFAHAHSDVSSPVLRGKWVREVLLCQPVADPPPNADVVLPPPVEGQTTRERYEVHRNNPACSGCHAVLDDLGFGFEAFDNVGRFRTKEAGKDVDTRGALRSTDIDGDFVGVRDLGTKLASSRQAHDCFARQWFRFTMGRMDSSGEACAIEQMSKAVREGGGIRELVHVLVRSSSFHQRRSP